MKNNLFSKDEVACSDKFDQLFSSEIKLFSNLFEQLESFVSQISGKIKDTERPDYTVEILLVHNLSLFACAFNQLRSGYLGVSQATLRSIAENLTMSMYYWEFPEHEKKYRDNTRSLWNSIKQKGYAGEWMDLALARIDKEGKVFKILDESGERSWQKFISQNLMEEASSFLHQNFHFVEALVYQTTSNDGKNHFVYGPHWNNDEVMKNGLWKLIEALIFETIVFDTVFKKFINVNDRKLVGEAVDQLNEWKIEYNKSEEKL